MLLTQARLMKRIPAGKTKIIQLDVDWPLIAVESADSVLNPVQAHHLAYMIYTSGSTGQPKGVMNTHLGIVNRLMWMQDAYRLTPSDCVLQKTPFSFDVSVWEFFWPLLTGAKLVLALPGGHKDAVYLTDLIAREQITTLHFVPSMLNAFLEQEDLAVSCRSSKRVICSGEALSLALQQRFFARLSCELHNLYGPTEAAVDVTYWACERKSQLNTVPIGRPIANTQIYILDRHLQPVPMGLPGELHIGGVGLARGYHNRPELTAEKFIANPFSPEPGARLYKSGDLARYLPDGNLEFLGRIDQQVKIRGFRIELGEVESALSGHPAVRENAVIAREDTPGGKNLVGYLVVREEPGPTVTELREFLLKKLPDYMVPAAFVKLERLPLTPSGKIDRQALPPPDENRLGLGVQFVAPRTPTEVALAKIWRELLGLNQIGIHENYFELGGHSLMAVRLVGEIKRQMKLDLPVRTVFRHPTIKELAETLPSQKHKERKAELVQLQAGNSGLELCLLIDEGSFGLFKLARFLGKASRLYASVVPLSEATLMASTKKKFSALPRMEDLAAEHVALIKSRQTTGPVVLAGHCFGGVMAFEVAHQLQDAGIKVEAVLFLDTWMTDPPFWWQKKAWLQEHLGKLLQQGPKYLWRKSWRRINLEKVELFSRLEMAVRHDFNVQVPLAIRTRIYQHAMNSYRPKVLATRGILFVPQNDWLSNAYRSLDDSLGSSKLFSNGIEVINVPGNHVTLFDEMHLPELGRLVSKSLDQL